MITRNWYRLTFWETPQHDKYGTYETYFKSDAQRTWTGIAPELQKRIEIIEEHLTEQVIPLLPEELFS